MRKEFIVVSAFILLATLALGAVWPYTLLSLLVTGPMILIGVRDMTQTSRSIRRNFPVLGHMRYLLERIRPEIQQYFIETNQNGVPFSRKHRSVVYQRSKKALETLPFGTQLDVYENGYEWVNHSLAPRSLGHKDLRVKVGGPQCKHPYEASVFNISAMSYGALSKNAIMALNSGAKMGRFAHNTGEGGLTPHHLAPGGDLIWEVGTGYFSCRNPDGSFSPERFAERAAQPAVKMIEIKLSQGAKPGHGGILPAGKVTAEVAAIRGVPLGQDVVSPPAHSVFSTPIGLLEFVQRLRELSGGKPIGFKLCIGKRREFISICKAMVKTGIMPDYIAIDGGEGGTGAAPLEFSDHMGCPLNEGLVFAHNALVGYDLRRHMRIFVSGKITTGFDIISKIAMGADVCYSARGMMMALGCIQALQCNTNTCPTGVATQDPWLYEGLVVDDKKTRVYNFHKGTVHSVCELLGAMGLEDVHQLRPWHIMRRVGPFEVKHYGELFEYLEPGALLGATLPAAYARACEQATAEMFDSTTPRSPTETHLTPVPAMMA